MKKIFKISATILLLFSLTTGFAQENSIGFKLGRPVYLTKYYYEIGGHGVFETGVYYKHSFNNNLILGFNVNVNSFQSNYPMLGLLEYHYFTTNAINSSIFFGKVFQTKNVYISTNLHFGFSCIQTCDRTNSHYSPWIFYNPG